MFAPITSWVLIVYGRWREPLCSLYENHHQSLVRATSSAKRASPYRLALLAI